MRVKVQRHMNYRFPQFSLIAILYNHILGAFFVARKTCGSLQTNMAFIVGFGDFDGEGKEEGLLSC